MRAHVYYILLTKVIVKEKINRNTIKTNFE